MANVSLNAVNKVYPGDVHAVKDASLEVADKEFVVLVGPSGCGKSTTLRMIAGLEEITSGTIEINGRVVNDVPPKDRDIAMVFQNYALYPHMTVYGNMAFGLKLRKFKKDEIDARVQDAAQILGIGELLERKPKALSGGERQRVAVGRAIVRHPAVFLFDEPLSNLDAKLRVEMRAELNKLSARLETTMIYVTHDQVEAMTLGDRIVLMKDGDIQQVAEPVTIYDQPVNRFVAQFIGTPPMNFFEGSLDQAGGGGMQWTDGEMVIPLPASLNDRLSSSAGKKVSFGIRPEDMHAGEADGGFAEATRIKAKVEVVEPLGYESLIYAACGKQSFVMKVDSHFRINVGSEIDVAINLARIHVFEAETERNLTLGETAEQPLAQQVGSGAAED